MVLLYLVYVFFIVYLLIQMVIRLALINILLALAPAALGLWILPHTSGWGRQWLRLFMTSVFQQSVQLIALALGIGFLQQLAPINEFEPVGDLIWKFMISVAFMCLATRVPSMLGNFGTYDAWLHTMYFGLGLVGGVSRSMRSLGLIAGGTAAGGPAGVAAAAGAATVASTASAAAGMARSAADLGTASNQPNEQPGSAGE